MAGTPGPAGTPGSTGPQGPIGPPGPAGNASVACEECFKYWLLFLQQQQVQTVINAFAVAINEVTSTLIHKRKIVKKEHQILKEQNVYHLEFLKT